MAAISKQQLENASIDADDLAEVTNGADNVDVTSRLGRIYPTLAKWFKEAGLVVANFSANGAAAISLFAANAATVLAQNGYSVPVTYAASLNMTAPNQTVSYNGQVYAPIQNQLPFTTSGTFETAKFRVIQGVVSTDLSPRTGASLVGWSQAESNSSLRSLLDKNRERRSIEDFWVSGDGSDYSNAIDKANLAGIDTLYLNSRAYNHSNTILLDDGFSLVGKGKKASRLIYQGTTTAISLKNRSGATVRTYAQRLTGLTLLGPGKTVGVGINMDSVSEALLMDLEISSFGKGHDMHSGISGGSVYNRLIAVKCQTCTTGFDWRRDSPSNTSSYTSATTALALRANNCDLGISITGGNENALIKAQIESCIKGAYVDDLVVGANSCDMNTFSTGRFEDNGTDFEVGSGARYTQFLDMDFVDNKPYTNNGVATRIRGGKGANFEISRIADANGSWRYERIISGGVDNPLVVFKDSNSLGSPITVQVENASTDPGARFARYKYGNSIKLDVQAPSGKLLYPTPTNGPMGTFTITAGAPNFVVANTCVAATSRIFIQAVNVNAAKLMGSAQALYISAKTDGVSFTVATADGTNIALAGCSFSYWIVG